MWPLIIIFERLAIGFLDLNLVPDSNTIGSDVHGGSNVGSHGDKGSKTLSDTIGSDIDTVSDNSDTIGSDTGWGNSDTIGSDTDSGSLSDKRSRTSVFFSYFGFNFNQWLSTICLSSGYRHVTYNLFLNKNIYVFSVRNKYKS